MVMRNPWSGRRMVMECGVRVQLVEPSQLAARQMGNVAPRAWANHRTARQGRQA